MGNIDTGLERRRCTLDAWSCIDTSDKTHLIQRNSDRQWLLSKRSEKEEVVKVIPFGGIACWRLAALGTLILTPGKRIKVPGYLNSSPGEKN